MFSVHIQTPLGRPLIWERCLSSAPQRAHVSVEPPLQRQHGSTAGDLGSSGGHRPRSQTWPPALSAEGLLHRTRAQAPRVERLLRVARPGVFDRAVTTGPQNEGAKRTRALTRNRHLRARLVVALDVPHSAGCEPTGRRIVSERRKCRRE